MNSPSEPEVHEDRRPEVSSPALAVPGQPDSGSHGRTFTPKLVLGLFIILMGLVLTLDNLVPSHGIAELTFRFWPLVLVVMGYAKLRSEGGSGSFGGYALIAGGVLGLLVTFGYRHVQDFIGPAILLALGIWIVLRALKQHRGVPAELQASDAFQTCSSIMGGCTRRPVGLFKGAELTAMFGGFELDLRKATLDGESARADVFVLFGGGEIRVPEEWEVRNQVTAIAGGVNDKTHSPAQPGPRLVVTGLVLFGGVEIKN